MAVYNNAINNTLSNTTLHGIVVGQALSPVSSVVLAAGQVLVGTTASDPVAATIGSGTNITVTSASGSISIALSGQVAVANGGTGVATITNHGIVIGQGTSPVIATALTDGQLLIGSTGADPAAASLTAGTGISITPGAGSITIAATGSSLAWTVVTGTTQALVANNGYFANNAGLVTLTLPATAAVGDTFRVAGLGAGGWLIAQNASQLIHVGSAVTTTGITGSIASTNQYDAIMFVCSVANTTFNVVEGPVGNLLVS